MATGSKCCCACAGSFLVLLSLIGGGLTKPVDTQQPKYPVILIPGDGGSQLYAKLNRDKVPHFYCSQKTTDYYNIWLSIFELAASLDCFVDNMRLRYNNTTHTTQDAEGVDIRIDSFGDPSTVEWLDPSLHESQLGYFYQIVETLTTINYTRNKDIRGAPYDFRRAPNELDDFYNNLTKLIEDTYASNSNTPVVIVAHSMGNPVMLYFYNKKSQSWKDKYIRAHISLAGVWTGAVKPLRLMTSGDSLGVRLVNPLQIRPMQRAMPSTAFLMPSVKYWKNDTVYVVTEHRNYTLLDYKQFFEDIDYTEGYMMWQDTQGLIADFAPPGVEIHCLYGFKVPTPGVLIFGAGEFPDSTPRVIPDDGDGTVNIQSLEAFKRWSGQQKQPVKHLAMENVEHMVILSHPDTLKYLTNFLQGNNVLRGIEH